MFYARLYPFVLYFWNVIPLAPFVELFFFSLLFYILKNKKINKQLKKNKKTSKHINKQSHYLPVFVFVHTLAMHNLVKVVPLQWFQLNAQSIVLKKPSF